MRFIHVDDNPTILENVHDVLVGSAAWPGLELLSLCSPDEFRAHLSDDRPPDLVLLDVNFGRGRERMGLELLRETRQRWPRTPVIAFSMSDSPATLVALKRSGATDFVPSDAAADMLVARIQFALASSAVELPVSQRFEVVGSTLRGVAQRVPRLVASALSCIHIHGESGTGKEVVAQLFRVVATGPFLAVNCGGVAEGVLESTLFGHRKGAFTGADRAQKGVFEEASGGWVFLDEVADLSPRAQTALLRVIENGEVVPVGASTPLEVRVRILSATNKDLEQEVSAGHFRRDLYERLREKVIELPPLRERPSEIRELVEHFCSHMTGGPYRVSPQALLMLERYPWNKGNVRELRNTLRAMTEFAVGGELPAFALPDDVLDFAARQSCESGAPAKEPSPDAGGNGCCVLLPPLGEVFSASNFQWSLIDDVIFTLVCLDVACREEISSVRALAVRMGISPTTAYRRLRQIWDEQRVPEIHELSKRISIM